MKIKIWGDFACPFCYMGETQLENLLAECDDKHKYQIEFHAYELDPTAPTKPMESMTKHFMDAHNMSEADAVKQIEHITRLASHLNLDINLADTKVCSTLNAHRLMKFASSRLDQPSLIALNFALFKANFVDNKCLSDDNVLIEIATKHGLNSNEVAAMLNSDEYKEEVRQDENALEHTDFEYIPYMEFPGGTILQGVISVGDLKKTLQ